MRTLFDGGRYVHQGIVIRAIGGFFRVLLDDGRVVETRPWDGYAKKASRYWSVIAWSDGAAGRWRHRNRRSAAQRSSSGRRSPMSIKSRS